VPAGKTPVNLDEIFQKPSLNFFKKTTEGESTTPHDDHPPTTATTEKDKQLARTKKEDTEKKQKEEKAKKDKADKENADHAKDVKSASGLFKRAANTLLESTSKPGILSCVVCCVGASPHSTHSLTHSRRMTGTISSSDVAGLFNKAKSLVSSTFACIAAQRICLSS
jgi:hypothetical protein